MLQDIITTLPILILEIDKEGMILNLNSDSPSFLGLNPNSLLNDHVSRLFPDYVVNKVEGALSDLKRRKPPSLINYTKKLDDGNHWFEARFVVSGRNQRMVIIQDITQHKMGESQIQKQLEQMSALRAIDHAITSSFNLEITLSILLKKLIDTLNIDAACILLLNTKTKRLEYISGLGFWTKSLRHTSLRIGEGYAGISALERRIVQKLILHDDGISFLRSHDFGKEYFVSYVVVPLIAKGQVRGVLEIFNRSSLNPSQDWLNFLEMLARQAAIAIDNSFLFNDLQRSNAEIMTAYDNTLEGWSRAMDMRDQDTEGHTKRVADMVVNLAKRIGISDSDLIHIHRGAALHDIGKIGIPDHILHKPGSLSEEEWEIMRLHPQYACELLTPIEYLSQAKDIPCYHHERWDGSGYPAGLRGEEIPLPARLFAVVDVYDALISDRPYRSAWSKQAAIEYIRDNSGSLFDPKIVTTFLTMVKEEYSNLQ